jgi:hypothetical protein
VRCTQAWHHVVLARARLLRRSCDMKTPLHWKIYDRKTCSTWVSARRPNTARTPYRNKGLLHEGKLGSHDATRRLRLPSNSHVGSLSSQAKMKMTTLACYRLQYNSRLHAADIHQRDHHMRARMPSRCLPMSSNVAVSPRHVKILSFVIAVSMEASGRSSSFRCQVAVLDGADCDDEAV